MKGERSIPAFPAFRIPGRGKDHPGLAIFWCPYCQVWHMHGAGNGHRVAHCVGDSPLSATGYYIDMVGELPEIPRRPRRTKQSGRGIAKPGRG